MRAAIFVPLAFGVTGILSNGSDADLFACFGAFAMLVLVDFSGPFRARMIAYVWLFIFGLAAISIATLASDYTLISVVLAAVTSFGIIFSGVFNGYFAAAQNGAILLIVLPLMVPGGADAIPDRLFGWTIASALAIFAVAFVWPTPWTRALHKSAARTCRALAAAALAPADKEVLDKAGNAVIDYRNTYVGKPNRPTGAAGPSAAVAGLVDELGWFLLLLKVPPRIDEEELLRDPSTGPTLAACARALEYTAERLEGNRREGGPAHLEKVREELLVEIRGEIEGDETDVAKVSADVNKVFWLRRLCTSAMAIGDLGVRDLDWSEPEGVLGSRVEGVSDATGLVVHGAEAATRLVAEQAEYHSVWLRRGLRGAIGIGLAVFVAEATDAQNAFWVVLGTLSVLRTTSLGTRASAWSALLGTLVGIFIGAGLIVLAGTDLFVLWIMMPLAVLAAAYASKAVSFAAGQAGFSILVMVLFNLIEPIGWQIGLVRIEDVLMGCAVSLVVGALFWPTGTKRLIRNSLAATLDAASRLQAKRAHAVTDGLAIDANDVEQRDTEAKMARLDAAIRQHIAESGPARLNSENLAAIAAVCARLRHSAESAEFMSHSHFYAASPEDKRAAIHGQIDLLRGWYEGFSQAIAADTKILDPTADVAAVQRLSDSVTTRTGLDPDQVNAVLTTGWLLQHLEYVGFLETWIAPRAAALDPA